MKKIILIAVVFVASIAVSYAQDTRQPKKLNAQEMTDRMSKDLELTKEQYISVLAINKEMVQMVEKSGGREADQETKTKIRKQHLAKLNGVLTPEQMAKVKENRKERKEMRSQRVPLKRTVE